MRPPHPRGLEYIQAYTPPSILSEYSERNTFPTVDLLVFLFCIPDLFKSLPLLNSTHISNLSHFKSLSLSLSCLPPPALAEYPELILGAIEAIDDKNGANTAAISKHISKHIESMYGELPALHSPLLSHHLNRMKQTGELVLFKGNYSGGDAPATSPRPRGRPKSVDRDAKLSVSGRKRGRPAKVVDPAGLVSLKRPRGRPAKAATPLPPKRIGLKLSARPRGRPPKKVDSSGSRPRGRPPKNVNAEAPALSPRPRGRPPKNSVSKTNVTLSRPRGRPPKKNVDSESFVSLPVTNSPSLSGRKRGRPKKIVKSGDEPSGTKRGRGRPAKVQPVE